MSPEILFPGVYVEEIPSPGHPIEGVSTNTLSRLKTIVAHVRKCGRGTRVLFTGPGKIARLSAARVLARELQLRPYRVELSEVVSKYIGETEKNLRRLFDVAEKGGAILFFDEADALFGKRSEVKDGHDKYADIEAAYLFQRFGEFEGVVVLAATRKDSLDSAFIRRFQATFSISLGTAARPAQPKRKRQKDD